MRSPSLCFAAFLLLASVGLSPVDSKADETLRISFLDRRPSAGFAPRTVLVRRTDDAPLIDGRLEDACWREAAHTSDFYDVSDGSPSGRPIKALLCHNGAGIFIGTVCEMDNVEAAADADGYSVEILFDSLHNAKSYRGLAVHLDGRWSSRAFPGARWDSRAQVASSREANTWTVECALPRAAFDDPDNAIWGFNVILESPAGTYSWNRLEGSARDATGFGHASFETPPCTIKAASLEALHPGRNTLKVAVLNNSLVNMDFRAGLVVRYHDGRQAREKYRFSIPPREGHWLGFDFKLEATGACDIAFGVMDDRTEQAISAFRRPGLFVRPILELQCTPEPEERGRVEANATIRLPPAKLAESQIMVTVKEKASGKSVAFARKRSLPSDAAKILCETETLQPGEYVLRATVTSPGASGTATAPFTIPAGLLYDSRSDKPQQERQ